MTEFDRKAHWQGVYSSKSETEVSWFEQSPAMSLDLIRRSGAGSGTSIIDVGGGASRLVDALLDSGYRAITVLDLSEKALSVARARLGPRASQVRWIAADVTRWEPEQKYDLWHDRAAFHFLTDPDERRAYVERLMRGTSPGAQVIIGTFAPDGPERCSGLPVARHDANSLQQAFGESFELEETRPYEHRTPGGGIQRFQFSRFRKLR
ncbi:MAG TPA: class I SAM-dependent methyltransferase [Xanthobacteraceae bacterium]|nr:class I SAM-dependent methyltransferase [Xanthobacteraceae bacterium]